MKETCSDYPQRISFWGPNTTIVTPDMLSTDTQAQKHGLHDIKKQHFLRVTA